MIVKVVVVQNYIVGQACNQQSSDLAQEERRQAFLAGRRARGDTNEGKVEQVCNVSKSAAQKDYLHLRDGQDWEKRNAKAHLRFIFSFIELFEQVFFRMVLGYL